MKTRTLLLLLLLLPLSQGAVARVYMCVDPQTGTTSFTDKACEMATSGEEVKVNGANYSSGRSARPSSRGPKVWNSHRDERKTGRDYNDERRRLYQEKATTSIAGG
jgi:hypothetical protein